MPKNATPKLALRHLRSAKRMTKIMATLLNRVNDQEGIAAEILAGEVLGELRAVRKAMRKK